MTCKTCKGRGKVQAGYGGEELEDCPDCTPCRYCDGTGVADSGGFTPWGAPIDLPCEHCGHEKRKQCTMTGAAWYLDSSLERWFPFSAQQIERLNFELAEQRVLNKTLNTELTETKAIMSACVTAVPLWWMPRRTDPTHAGWYYVRETTPRLCIGIRYFDDSKGEWWAVSKDGKNDGSLVPNESFHDWLTIPNISDRQRH